MHTTLLRWAAVFGAMLFSLAAIAAEPAGIRDPVRMKFDGVEKVSERDILAALLIDFDVALAAHPDAPLDGYLRAVETSTLLGYRHSGFRDAVVAATHDEQQSQIVMRVKEGLRYFCGDVNISGAKSADIGLLIQAITQPTNKESTPWIEGRPVPFDVATTRETILRLKSAFAAQGFLRSSFSIQNTAGTGNETATLEITVQDEGPRAEIGQIIINGNERDSDADLLQYLNLQPGQRYDSNLEERLQSRLEASGRFLSTTVTRVGNTRIEGDKEIVGLSLELRDYDFAPPLTKAFTAEETALLKLRDWLGRWANGKTDHDIVCEMTLGPQGLDKLFDELEMPLPSQYRGRLKRADLRIVISPHHGQTLTLRLFDAKQQPLFDEAIVFYPDHLLIGNSVRGVKFQVPHPNAGQLTVNIQAKTDKSSAESERPFSLKLGMTVKSRPHTSGTAVRVATEISTGAALSFFEPANEATCRLRNGAWKLRSGKLRGQIDATTGQLLKFSAKSPSGKNKAEGQIPNKLKIFTESAAFERETRAIEQALALAQAQDTHDGLKSFLNFALEEWSFALTQLGAAEDQVAAWNAVHKFLSCWSPPPLAHLLPAHLAAELNDDFDPTMYRLSWDKQSWYYHDFARPNSLSRKFAAAVALPALRLLVSSDNWLWTAGRDELLIFAADASTAKASLLQQASSPDLGPLAAVALTFVPDSDIAEAAARHGQRNLTLENLRRDIQPLFAGDSWLSQWILSVVEAIRALDEKELRAMTAFIDTDESTRHYATAFLLMLKDEPQQPAAEAVTRAINVLWHLGLNDALKNRLNKIAPLVEIAQRPDAPGAPIPAPPEPSLKEYLKALGSGIEKR